MSVAELLVVVGDVVAAVFIIVVIGVNKTTLDDGLLLAPVNVVVIVVLADATEEPLFPGRLSPVETLLTTDNVGMLGEAVAIGEDPAPLPTPIEAAIPSVALTGTDPDTDKPTPRPELVCSPTLAAIPGPALKQRLAPTEIPMSPPDPPDPDVAGTHADVLDGSVV